MMAKEGKEQWFCEHSGPSGLKTSKEVLEHDRYTQCFSSPNFIEEAQQQQPRRRHGSSGARLAPRKGPSRDGT